MDALLLPRYTISKELVVLRNSNLLTNKKEGAGVYYGRNKDSFQNRMLINLLKKYLNQIVFREDERYLQRMLKLR
ncbi:MAG: hypothetical protein ACP5P3_03750 [Ignavibacteria bacterium]